MNRCIKDYIKNKVNIFCIYLNISNEKFLGEINRSIKKNLQRLFLAY